MTKLKKRLDKTHAKVEFSRALLSKAGLKIDKEEVVKMISDILDDEPDVRSFSKLTAEDFSLMCKFVVNSITFNEFLLERFIPDNLIPSAFLDMLRITRSVSSRALEAGCRKSVNIFLVSAVAISREAFNEKRLIVGQEHPTGPVEVPEIGFVQGPLDCVTGRAAGQKLKYFVQEEMEATVKLITKDGLSIGNS